MADTKVGGIFVEIITKSWERFKTLVLDLRKHSEQLDKHLAGIGKTADIVGAKLRNAFLAGSGVIGGLLAAADPGGMGVLAMKAEILARSMGRIFMPLEQKVSTLLDKLTNYFNGLSPATQNLIADTTTWAAGIAVVGWGLSKVVKLVAAIGSLGVIGKVGLIIGALVAAFKLGEWIADKINGKATSPRLDQANGGYNRSFMAVPDAFKALNTAKGNDLLSTVAEQTAYLKQIAENTKPKEKADGRLLPPDNQGLMLA